MSEELVLKFVDPKPMRYGENSHQSAVFYRDPTCTEASLATAKQLWGKELSYNNIVDADAAKNARGITVSYSLKPHKVFLFNKETEERVYFEVK